MTNLIFFEAPLLLLIPVLAVIASVVCAILKGRTVVSYIGAVIHAFAIAATVYFGGNLTDVFFTLTVSLIASVICEKIKGIKAEEEEK